jgi:hypothetical protein
MYYKRPVFKLTVAAALYCIVSAAPAEELSAESFARIHSLIRPAKDESKWLDVPWLTDVWEARQRGAAEGRPILLWSGGGAAPIGGC